MAKRKKKWMGLIRLDWKFGQRQRKGRSKAVKVEPKNGLKFFTSWELYMAGKHFRDAAAKGKSSLRAYCLSSISPRELEANTEYAINNATVAGYMVRNKEITDSQLTRIAKNGNVQVKRAVLKKKNLSEDVLRECKAKETLHLIVTRENCPNEFLKIGFLTSHKVRIGILGNPKTSPEELNKADLDDFYQALAIAKNKSASPEQWLKVQAKWKNNQTINRAFATNRAITKEMKEELIKVRDYSVVAELAKWVEKDFYPTLMKFRNDLVRRAMAAREDLGVAYENVILRSGDGFAIGRLASNEGTSIETQNKIYAMAEAHPEMKEFIIYSLSKNPKLEQWIADEIAENGNEQAKMRLVMNGLADESILPKAPEDEIRPSIEEVVEGAKLIPALVPIESVNEEIKKDETFDPTYNAAIPLSRGSYGTLCIMGGEKISGKHADMCGSKCREKRRRGK